MEKILIKSIPILGVGGEATPTQIDIRAIDEAVGYDVK